MDLRYAEMEVSFSSADWVVSLGVGVEIPRMGEKLGSLLWISWQKLLTSGKFAMEHGLFVCVLGGNTPRGVGLLSLSEWFGGVKGRWFSTGVGVQ